LIFLRVKKLKKKNFKIKTKIFKKHHLQHVLFLRIIKLIVGKLKKKLKKTNKKIIKRGQNTYGQLGYGYTGAAVPIPKPVNTSTTLNGFFFLI
jgi:hypothetical protein